MNSQGSDPGFSHLPAPAKTEFVLFGALVAASLVAAAIPPWFDSPLASLLTFLSGRFFPARTEKIARRMVKILGSQIGDRNPSDIARAWQRNKFEIQLAQLRGIWRQNTLPNIEVVGREHIEKGLAKGKGVILWIISTGGPLLYKQGLSLVPVRLVHLTSQMHGAPRRSAFGVGRVAPFRRKAEDPYIAERVTIPLDGSLNYLITLKERLAANACVSIVGEYRGRQNVRAPLFQHAVDFAMGAPSLAGRGGCTLLTVYAERKGKGDYRVVVEEPITIEAADRKDFSRKAVLQFASRLERRIEVHPELWDGWGDPPPLHPQETADGADQESGRMRVVE